MLERRRRQRFPLRCGVLFDRDGSTQATSTINISSHGFLCLLPDLYTPGEALKCTVDLGSTGMLGGAMVLECDVVVLRAEVRPEGFRTAFRIEDYAVIQTAKQPTASRQRFH